MMMPYTTRTALILAVLCLTIAGCGGPERPELVPVSGVVLDKDGKPVVGAEVSFHNGDAPRAAVGTTDSEGKFQLTSFDEGDGAIPGDHKISIAKTQTDAAISGADAEDPSAAYAAGMDAAASGNMEAIQKNELDAKYANPETSGLERTVTKEGPNNMAITLQ